MDDLSRRDTMSFETDTDYDYEDMYCDNPPQEDAEEYSAAVSGSIEKRRKKRNRKKRRKKRLGLWILIIIAVIVLAVLFGRSSYFNIDEIQVKGNHYYTDEQIISMAGAQTGINTFSAGTGNMEKLLCDDSYIATADVKRKLPNVLEITIRERTETAAVYSEKNYYIVDGSGYILKVTAERPDVTRVLGLTVKNGKEGEGMFAASVVDFGSANIAAGPPSGYIIPQADGGYYMAYNVMAVTAAKDTFIEWESVLTKCLGTLAYSESFVKATEQAGEEKVAMSKEISRITNERLEIIMAAWEDRNVEQDITSQMQSDETGGYERVYDTQTGEIYRAEAGWYESTGSDRYKPVTENKMYAEPISGYIE